MVEHFLGKEEVTGSIPVNGSTLFWKLITPFTADPLPYEKRYALLVGREYVSGVLSGRFIEGEFTRVSVEPIRVFLCHTSADKPFVRQVAHDLRARGYGAWLDEVEIRAGQSLIGEVAASN